MQFFSNNMWKRTRRSFYPELYFAQLFTPRYRICFCLLKNTYCACGHVQAGGRTIIQENLKLTEKLQIEGCNQTFLKLQMTQYSETVSISNVDRHFGQVGAGVYRSARIQIRRQCHSDKGLSDKRNAEPGNPGTRFRIQASLMSQDNSCVPADQ